MVAKEVQWARTVRRERSEELVAPEPTIPEQEPVPAAEAVARVDFPIYCQRWHREAGQMEIATPRRTVNFPEADRAGNFLIRRAAMVETGLLHSSS